MLTILCRTIIIYVILIGTMRLMGKRQLGELEISELVTTLLLSEIATLPIADLSVPVIVIIIPLVTILTLEIVLSIILLKCPFLKNIASARPSILIRHGKVDQGELKKVRISIDELISEVRQAGMSTLDDVDYAILEQNGKISIIPRKSAQPPSAALLGLEVEESGIIHILIADGHKNRYNMKLLSVSDAQLAHYLKQKDLSAEQIFLLGMDDERNLYWIKKEESA